MSALKITKATIGYGPRTVDVTNTISSLVGKGGELEIKNFSAKQFLEYAKLEDPAPDQKKVLTISFTINNGEVNTRTIDEDKHHGIFMVIPNGTEGLEIKNATYYSDSNKSVDVTEAVKALVTNGTINVKISPETLGVNDPAPNEKKFLSVESKINGTGVIVDKFYDEEIFSLSAPPRSSTGIASSATSFDFTGYVFSFLTSIFGSVLYGFGTWICAFAWYDVFSKNYGDVISYIAFAFGFLSSIPGIFLLLIVVFFRRVFLTTDLTLTNAIPLNIVA